MKHFSIFLFLIFISVFANGQNEIPTNVTYIKCTDFQITKPMMEYEPVNENEIKNEDRNEVEIHREYIAPKNLNSLPIENDPIAQSTMGTKKNREPIANWLGQDGGSYPQDPTGAANENYYVQGVNTKYRVYTKTGGVVSGGGSFNLNTLWPGSGNDGDPIILYDKYADRWFISQFNDPDKVLIAISTTNDPTGDYYAYSFTPQAGDFPDYPKYSIWSDGYYCTSNIGNPGKMAVFDRNKMINGDASAGMIAVTYPDVPDAGFFCPLSADADGELPPFGTPCPLFAYADDSWSMSGGTDKINIYNFNTNWTTPSSSSITFKTALPTAAFNVSFNPNWNDIRQPVVSQKLDAIAGVFMFRAQYRVWTGYNSVVLCQAVIVNNSTKQAGIRWYELRQNSATGDWSIYQQGTYSPDTDSRWCGSIAMDDNGSIGMAYNVSSTNTSPSLRFTGRNAADPLGEFTYEEQSAFEGSGAQSGVERWGDYSHTSLDPDGITFWHTGMYVISDNPKTRIFSFQIPPNILSTGEIEKQTQLTYLKNNTSIIVNASALPNNEGTNVDLFDAQGKLISSQIVKPFINNLKAEFDIQNLSKGIYLIRVGNMEFQKVIKVSID